MAQESIFQPEWSPSGELHFVSDRTGWWNLYRLRGETIEPLAPMEAEFGTPQWVFAMSTYAFLADGRIASIVSQDGLDRLVTIHPASRPRPSTCRTPRTRAGCGPAATRWSSSPPRRPSRWRSCGST